ncbi:hypothetical protein [Rohdeia mirabilis]|uniref:hypothetical protein n=1 Tax=Rohdeia mirabilis TaxID=2528008 RepID=UPI003AF37470
MRDQWLGPVTGLEELLEVRTYLWRGREPLRALAAAPGVRGAAGRTFRRQESWFMTFVVPEHARMWGGE